MLTNTTNVNRYQIVGTPLSTYSISYPYWDKSEIVVYLTESDGSLTTLTMGTNYTLSTPNGNNGTLTRVGDWTAGATNLTIARVVPITQETDLRNGDKIDAETLETALDKLTAEVQQLNEAQGRVILASIDEAGDNLVLPSESARQGSGSGTIMGFNGDGDEIILRDLAGFDADVASAASNASSASTSAGTASTQALKSEGYAVGEQNGTPVTSGSPYYENNSKYYFQRVYSRTELIMDHITEIDNVSNNISDVSDVADDISNVVAVAGDLTNIDSVAGDLTNIDAVNTNKTNIDTVAGIATDVSTVAGIASDVTTVVGSATDIATVATDIADVSAVASDITKVSAVADDLSNIDDVADDLTNIDTVATDITDVSAVGSNIAKVTAVADDLTLISAVNSNKTNIDTVAGISSDVHDVASIEADVSAVASMSTDIATVAGIDSAISDVASIDSDVTAVASHMTEIENVEDKLTAIGTVATNIADVSAVASDITKINAVADDLTNIDAVADDLTNIDAASSYALEAEGWANGTQGGTPVSSGSPYYENNAKYWASAVPAIQDKLGNHEARLVNLETKAGDEIVVTYPSTTYGKDGVPTSVAPYAKVSELIGVSRINNQHIATSVLSSQTVQNVVFSVTADGELQLSGLASGEAQAQIVSNDVDASVAGHKYLLFGGSSTFNIRPYDSLDWDTGSGVVFEAQSALSLRLAGKIVSGTNYNEKLKICVRDLNQYFSSDPDVSVASLTLSDIQSDYPELLVPSSYDAGTKVDTSYTSVTSRFFNLLRLDNRTDVVTSDNWSASSPRAVGATKVFVGISGNNYFDNSKVTSYALGQKSITVNGEGGGYGVGLPVAVKPLTTYYFCFTTTYGIEAGEYDADGNFLGELQLTDKIGTTRANTAWVMVVYRGNNNTDILYDSIGVNISNSSLNGTYKAYREPVTLSLGQTVTLGSAGSVRQKFYPESGKKTNPIGTVIYDGSDSTGWDYIATYGTAYRFDCSSLVGKADGQVMSNLFIKGTIGTADLECIGLHGGDGHLMIQVSASKLNNTATVSALMTYFSSNNLEVNYELATPSADTQLTPILNPFLEVEGGGTIAPNQSQTIKIDSSMTAEYLAV